MSRKVRTAGKKSAKSTFPLLFAVPLIVLASGCETGTDHNFRPAWVSGIITDSLSGAPIDRALISLADTLIARDTTYTDTAGFYRAFAGSQGLSRSVFCRKAGYQSQKKILDLVQETTPVDFKMMP